MYCVKCGTQFSGKFCPECGASAPAEQRRFCPKCGTSVDDSSLKKCPSCSAFLPDLPTGSAPATTPNIIINNTNTNTVAAASFGGYMRRCNKWVAFFLCLFLGFFGGHKFYEGKIGMGILYLFTLGLFGIGVLVDLVVILLKPNPYYL